MKNFSKLLTILGTVVAYIIASMITVAIFGLFGVQLNLIKVVINAVMVGVFAKMFTKIFDRHKKAN